jgi:hypothetical protein
MTAEQKLSELQQRYALFRALVHSNSPDVADAMAMKHSARVVLDAQGEPVVGSVQAILADIAAHDTSANTDLVERFVTERNAAAAARPNPLTGARQ